MKLRNINLQRLNLRFILVGSLTGLFLSSASYASTPTSNSNPLPTLNQTHNMDTVLTEKVQAAIVKTPSLQGQSVSAACRAGVVTLQGSVANKAQENAAIAAAKSIKGVTKVNSQLTIKAISPTSR